MAGQSNRAYSLVVFVLGLLALGLPAPASGEAVPIGGEFRVNTYTPGPQVVSSISSLTNGGFVVVWHGGDQDGSSFGIFGQRYASSGETLGSEFRVNTFTTGYQVRPAVSSDAAGNFVIVWSSTAQDGSSYGVFGQRYSSNGAALGGEFRVNTFTTGSQAEPAVSSDAAGNFVVVWESAGQYGSDRVFAQRYSSSGAALGGEFLVNTYITGPQAQPAVSSDTAGDFVVVWVRLYGYGSSYGVFGQRYSSSGAGLGGEFRVNTYTSGAKRYPTVGSDATGNFIVVWDSMGQDGSGRGLFGQRYASSGEALGGEFRVNTYVTGDQRSPAVSSDATGNFVVVWDSADQDGSTFGVFGQRYARSGAALGGEFQVNTYTTGPQFLPAVSSDAAGNFVATWDGSRRPTGGGNVDVFGQRFVVPTAMPTATPTRTATATVTPTATPTPTPLSLPGGSSVSQQLSVTESDRAVELTFQIVAPPIPGGCEVSVSAQPPTGQATSYPMTTDLQLQTIDQPQSGVWTIRAQSSSGCPDFSYYLFARAVPIVGAIPLGLLIMALGVAAVVHLRNRKGWHRLRT